MSEKFYIGSDITGFADNGKYKPISRVTLLVDDDNAITAGDDTGLEISASCPHATQEMADALLLKFKGYQYQAYTADAANIDPAAELGDGVTVGGVYAILSTVSDDGRGYADISAPGELEDEDEYPYESPIKKEIERNLATTRSLITKTSEEILLRVEEVNNRSESRYASLEVSLDGVKSEVSGKIDGSQAQTLIDQSIDKISLSVSSSNGSTTFTLMDGSAALSTQTLNLSVSAVNVTGKLTASQIDATELKVSAANITGSLTIGQLPDDVATSGDIPTNVSDLENDADYQTERGVVEIIGGTVDADYINALGVSASYLESDEIYIYDSSGKMAGFITTVGAASYDGRKIVFSSGAMEINASYGSLYLEGGDGAALDLGDLIYCNSDFLPNSKARYDLGSSTYQWNDVYCSTGEFNGSDENIKHDIEDLPEKYVAMLDMVAPKRYKLNAGTSDRYHVGFIAQDVEAAMTACGIDSKEFGGWAKGTDEDGNDIYMLRYTEFIAILLAKLRGMDERIRGLETAT